MKITDAIARLDQEVPNPKNGLPDDIFYYITRTTPMINVDLLVQHPEKGTLLSWRNDPYAGKGWHIPGGIIRYKESFAERILAVAKTELHTDQIEFDPAPIDVNEILVPEKKDRAHFISLLYRCTVSEDYQIDNGNLNDREPEYLKWIKGIPEDLLSFHGIYKKFL